MDCARSVRVAAQKAQEGVCEYFAEETPQWAREKGLSPFRGRSQPTGYFGCLNEQICSRTKGNRLTVVAETVQESRASSPRAASMLICVLSPTISLYFLSVLHRT